MVGGGFWKKIDGAFGRDNGDEFRQQAKRFMKTVESSNQGLTGAEMLKLRQSVKHAFQLVCHSEIF